MLKIGSLLTCIAALATHGPYEIQNPDALSVSGTAFEGKATVYVFRGGSSPTRPFYVSVDKTLRATIGRDTYVKLDVSPERHVFLVSPLQEGSEPSASVIASLSSDRTYYFSLNTDFTWVDAGMGQQKTSLVQISRSSAEMLLGKYHERRARK